MANEALTTPHTFEIPIDEFADMLRSMWRWRMREAHRHVLAVARDPAHPPASWTTDDVMFYAHEEHLRIDIGGHEAVDLAGGCFPRDVIPAAANVGTAFCVALKLDALAESIERVEDALRTGNDDWFSLRHLVLVSVCHQQGVLISMCGGSVVLRKSTT
jgi:hypothetical protein